LSRSVVHKNRNTALSYFGVIALCLFLHFELCPGHNLRTINVSTLNCVGSYILLIRSAVHRNRNLSLILELLPFVYFYTLKCLGQNIRAIKCINLKLCR